MKQQGRNFEETKLRLDRALERKNILENELSRRRKEAARTRIEQEEREAPLPPMDALSDEELERMKNAEEALFKALYHELFGDRTLSDFLSCYGVDIALYGLFILSVLGAVAPWIVVLWRMG